MIHPPFIRTCFLLGAAVCVVQPLMAQEGAELQEVVVTAQKRAENINKIGMQVTAISGDALAAQNITGPEDFANLVPGLSYTNSDYNTPVYTLRGVGFYDASLAAAPTVSVYTDEVSLPYSTLTKHTYFDLQRVEVLKGPQGTLYGQNATGGAINFIANKPTADFQAGVEAGYGNFNRRNVEGYVSGALTDNLNARFSGRFERGDAWQYSTTRPGDELGSLDNSMFRLILDYLPMDALRLTFNVNGWVDKSEPQAGQYKYITPQFPDNISPLQSATPFAPNDARAADWSPGSPRAADDRFYQASLKAQADVAKDISVVSITSYDNYRQNQGEDQDGIVALTLDHPEDEGHIKSFIQELRLSVDSFQNQRLLFGVNYEDSRVDQNILSKWGGTSAGQFFATIGYPVTSVFFATEQTKKSYAAFSNWEWDIDRITLRAGARYTSTKLTNRSCEYDPNNEGGTAGFFYDVVFGGAFGAYPGGIHCLAGNNLGQTINGVPPGAPGEYANELKENNVPFRVGMDWRITDTLLAYWNVSKGFKSGGYPTLAASAFRQYVPVTQESLLSYDVGFKSSLLEHRVQLNGAAFYYSYHDKQILGRVIDPVFGILSAVLNIPKSSVKGAELELVAIPLKGLRVNVSYTYLKATIDQFQGFNGAGITGNFSGTPVPFTPRNQAAVSVDYETPAFGAWTGDLGASVNYRSDTISVVGGEENVPPPAGPQNSRMLGISGYALIDLRAGLKSADDKWKIQLWAKNVANKYYWNNAVVDTDDISRFAGMPRTYGLNIGYTF
jgi:iron complex outermembrane receptor protein